MPKWTIFIIALVCMHASAQLTYRMNDPFLFCTRGQDRAHAPTPCWIPLPPYTGNSLWLPYCDPPNPYGEPWSGDDYVSYGQYLSICPQALGSGAWDGRGSPEHVPFVH